MSQWLEWAAKEAVIRKAEIGMVDSADKLKTVQGFVAKRRKAVGLTEGQAALAVSAAHLVDIGMRRKAEDKITWPVKAS
jgi:hypothetical protein